jgi:murein DD-endopeptidase MepM/ murein hydrolase activator NlpD
MPSSFNNKQGFDEKVQDEKIRKSYILTAVAICLALIIITVCAVIANRSRDSEIPEQKETEKSTVKLDETEKPTESEKATETEKPTQKPSGGSTNVSTGLPSFTLPVSGTLTNKHDPELQVFSPTMQDYRVHLGIDIQTAENAPVYAAADGTVSKIWVDTLMGYCVAVKHSGNCVTVYKNLAANLPEGIVEGTSVRSGQLIATVGNSAMVEVADEPHLHFEMTVSDLAVDPLEYFDDEALGAITKE